MSNLKNVGSMKYFPDFKRNPVEHQENYPGFNEFLDAKDYF